MPVTSKQHCRCIAAHGVTLERLRLDDLQGILSSHHTTTKHSNLSQQTVQPPDFGCFCVGTSKAMQGVFSLLLASESITSPALQRQLLHRSLELLEMSRGSAVQLLSHEAESAGQLMGLLREHAPKGPQDDHLLMLQGPVRDMV